MHHLLVLLLSSRPTPLQSSYIFIFSLKEQYVSHVSPKFRGSGIEKKYATTYKESLSDY